MNGIELGAKLKGDGIETYLVFLTSFAEFAADSYILEAYQYILKRDMKDRLGDVLRRIAKEKKTSEQDFLWVGDHEKKLFYKDIICVSKVKGQKYSSTERRKSVPGADAFISDTGTTGNRCIYHGRTKLSCEY